MGVGQVEESELGGVLALWFKRLREVLWWADLGPMVICNVLQIDPDTYEATIALPGFDGVKPQTGEDDVVQAAPQTTYSDLRHRAIHLLGAANASEFELHRLAADADKLMAVDPMGALEIKAVLAAVRGDHVVSAELFDRLLQMAAGEMRFLRCAVQVAAISGQVFRTKLLYDTFLAGHDLPVAWKQEMGRLLSFNGWFREAGRLQNELQESGQDPCTSDVSLLEFPAKPADRDGQSAHPIFAIKTSIAEILDETRVDDEEVVTIVAKAISLLRAWGYPPQGVHTETSVHSEGPPSVLVSFMVIGDVESVSDAEWRLYGELAGDEPKALMDGVIAVAVLACKGEARGD